MAKRGRKKTPVTVFNPRGESPTARKQRIARERKRYGHSSCFIATAVYGDPLAPEVEALRRFRDIRLRPYYFGRAAIITYYRLSPLIADWLKIHTRIAYIVRKPLDWIAKKYLWNIKTKTQSHLDHWQKTACDLHDWRTRTGA